AGYGGTGVSGEVGASEYTRPAREPVGGAILEQGIGDRARERLVHGILEQGIEREILEQGIEREFDLTYSQDLRLDYAFYVPLHFTMPIPAVPLVPLYVNVYLPPQPTPRRCYASGRALRGIIDATPEPGAVLASGGTA